METSPNVLMSVVVILQTEHPYKFMIAMAPPLNNGTSTREHPSATSGNQLLLDAGSAPGNNVGMKIWQCYDNLPAQAWYYTNDNRIALAGKGQCLDLTNGNLANGNQVQTYQCTDYNANQVWTR
ncbi:ricin B lectin domain-containing protein [Infundibulicybe gibba]|nr:ricin B lectin domain-containing protein [Infundibulicybe gibba]